MDGSLIFLIVLGVVIVTVLVVVRATTVAREHQEALDRQAYREYTREAPRIRELETKVHGLKKEIARLEAEAHQATAQQDESEQPKGR